MMIKVCGMREAENVKAVSGLEPDLMGFIFYTKSKRFTESVPDYDFRRVRKVGVFVNATLEEIEKTAYKQALEVIQLHGDESPEFTQAVKNLNVEVIKVFHIREMLPVDQMKPFVGVADYFLFDTSTKEYGGSGRKFDWQLLEKYDLETPFFLSGGIGLEDVEEIRSLESENLVGIDVNSRFEIEPGLKDVEKLKELFIALR